MNNSIGKQIDALAKLKSKQSALAAKQKELDAQYSELEAALLAKLKSDGVTKAAGKCGSVSITESVVATVKNWDEFKAWILETKSLHMLENRPAIKAFREMHEAGEEVPGVAPFIKTKLTLRIV